MGSFSLVCITAFSIGMAVFLIYVLVLAAQFFNRAIRALDIWLAEKARERYENWPK